MVFRYHIFFNYYASVYLHVKIKKEDSLMSYYFMANIYLKDKSKPKEYGDYIDLVKPIVEKYGGEYLVRTEEITYLSDNYTPDRIIIIRFKDSRRLNECFSSKEYKEIEYKRKDFVISKAVTMVGCDEDM